MGYKGTLDASGHLDGLAERYAAVTGFQRLLIALLGLLLPVLLFYWLSFMPKSARLQTLQTDAKVLTAQLNLLRSKARRAEEIAQLANRIEADFNAAMKALPATGEIPALLAGIADAGNAAGLDFLLFEPQAEKKQTFYAEIPIEIKVTGSFHGVGRFLESVARLPRVVNIESIAMAPDKKTGMLQIDCRAVTYKFDETAATQKPTEGSS